MAALAGRVAIITGAGRGLGRAHALLFASEGARVVVNDIGGAGDGTGADTGPAQAVVDEIRALGGEAIADGHDVSDWNASKAMIDKALAAYGRLDVVVNNAGILRDRFLVNMTEDEWDTVVAVHLKGHFAPTRFAAAWWRAQAKAGRTVQASVVNTSSTSGLLGNPGQANYGAAKAGIAALTVIAAQELGRYGVRVNAIVPAAARTRLTEAAPGISEVVQPPDDPSRFDVWDPANVSPVVGWLASESCPATGKILFVQGGKIQLFQPWTLGDAVERNERWSIGDLDREMKKLL
jgi:NAD(P)-dependent dehydrogenase (short-subunit alcohol dehydrogenase family)